MPTFPASTAISNAANQGTAKTLFEDQLAAIKQLPGASTRSTVTIASDQITPTQFAHRVDTESGAATDDLKNILQGMLPDGSLLLLSIVSAARTVRVWNAAGGTGQLTLKSGDNFWLGDPNHYLLLIRSGTTWEEIERFPNSKLVPIINKNSNYTAAVTDRGRQINSNGNDWTLTLPNAATVGQGFELYVLNTSQSGIVSIAMSGGDSIDRPDESTYPKLHPRETIQVISNGADAYRVVNRFQNRLPQGHLFGLTMSNDLTDATNDLRIGPGKCAADNIDMEDRATLRLTSTVIKQLDASWAAGSAAGGRISSESLVDGTWHVYLFRPLNGGTDICFSQSLTPTLPSSGTHKRRIGSILRESGAIVSFTQDGDLFERNSPILDVNLSNPGTSGTLAALSVPTGYSVIALITVAFGLHASSTTTLNLTDPAMTDQSPADNAAPLAFGRCASNDRIDFTTQMRTNTSRQIRYRMNASDGSTTIKIATRGWIDSRGRDN